MACKTQLITISLVNIVALFSLQRQSVTSERTRGSAIQPAVAIRSSRLSSVHLIVPKH